MSVGVTARENVMRPRTILLIAVILQLPLVSASAQDVRPNGEVSPPTPGTYYGGMPYYTAFHQFMATRLSILKASRDSKTLSEHLRLSQEQRSKIDSLRIHDERGLSDEVRATLPDENSQVDEDAINPDFYDFLDVAQRERLDRLTIEFDGYSALSLISVSKRLEISPEKLKSIRATCSKHREAGWLPFFRFEFASRWPTDHLYRRCVFAGQYALVIDQAILQSLEKDEVKRLSDWLSADPPPHAVTEAVRELAPLPEGLFGLAKYYGR